MKYLNFIIIILFSSFGFANDELEKLNMNPEAHTSQGLYKMYTHYVFYLTPNNTILPGDPRSPKQDQSGDYRDDIRDENHGSFEHGQFEVFIPVEKFPFKKECKNTIVLRMAWTSASEHYFRDNDPLKIHPNRIKIKEDYIREKQELYFKIKNMVLNNQGYVRVIIELGSLGCNAFFRNGWDRYISYTGQYIREY